MKASRLFLFMAATLVSVSAAHADTSPVPSSVASPAPSEIKEETKNAVITSTTKREKKAAKKKKLKKAKQVQVEKPIITEVTVPMAKGELEAEVAANQAQRERANAPRTSVEIGASSWKPKRATTYSRIPGTTDFDTKGLPSLDATIFAPLFGRHDLHVEGGLGFLSLHRTATITSSGLNVPQDENGYIFTFRVGVTYSPYQFAQDRVTPYVAAALLPSVLVTRETSFDSGTSDTGLPFEIGAGALVSLYQTLRLDVGVTETGGKVQDSDFNKFAVRAGLRMAL